MAGLLADILRRERSHPARYAECHHLGTRLLLRRRPGLSCKPSHGRTECFLVASQRIRSNLLRGLHHIPMPPKSPYDTGRLSCEMIATLIAHRIPKLATVTRAVDQRGRTVYIDYLQNLHGKTLASVYSARASAFAGVSTPLTWEELKQGARPQNLNLRTVLRRFGETGDRWATFRRLPGVDLHRVLEAIQCHD
jgi:hypothetical protein